MFSSLFLFLPLITTQASCDRVIPERRFCSSEGVFCFDASDVTYSFSGPLPSNETLMSLTAKRMESEQFAHTWFFWFAPQLDDGKYVNLTISAEDKSSNVSFVIVRLHTETGYGMDMLFNSEVVKVDSKYFVHTQKTSDNSSFDFATTHLLKKDAHLETLKQTVTFVVRNFEGDDIHSLRTEPVFLFRSKSESESKTKRPLDEPEKTSRKSQLINTVIGVSVVAIVVFIILLLTVVVTKKVSASYKKRTTTFSTI